MVKEATAEYSGKRLKIRNIANHYYVPVIVSGEKERIDYIKHVIQTPSEIEFLNHLESYVARPSNKFKHFDWWMFSRLDEIVDTIRIPYYDSTVNKIRDFKPDFVFWLAKGSDYFILFIDPKGTEHTHYQRKIEGCRTLFEQTGGIPKILKHDGKQVKVVALLRTVDADRVLLSRYEKYWFDDIDKALAKLT
jgi:type III restriction enzyme